jgi:hypothetical protein
MYTTTRPSSAGGIARSTRLAGSMSPSVSNRRRRSSHVRGSTSRLSDLIPLKRSIACEQRASRSSGRMAGTALIAPRRDRYGRPWQRCLPGSTRRRSARSVFCDDPDRRVSPARNIRTLRDDPERRSSSRDPCGALRCTAVMSARDSFCDRLTLDAGSRQGHTQLPEGGLRRTGTVSPSLQPSWGLVPGQPSERSRIRV